MVSSSITAPHASAFVPGGLSLAARSVRTLPSQSLSSRRGITTTTTTTRTCKSSSSSSRVISSIRMSGGSLPSGANADLARLASLPVPSDTLMAEYVWIDADFKVRSKGRTVSSTTKSPSDLPSWNYDGSSTGQAPGDDSEVILQPKAIYKDPFRGAPHILVMCDTYTPTGEPLATNTRFHCNKAMDSAKDYVPWFGLEQEYFLIDPATEKPLGFPVDGEPAPQGPYYCGIGAENSFGREIADTAWRAQLYAGLKVSGINAEVAPGQWEFQVGPCVGIEEGDMMWMGRYILERVAEIAGVVVTYEPKAVKGDWNGTGCHTNFSSKEMREPGGYESAIIPALEKLSKKHAEHIAVYGEGNDERLTGKHETAPITQFRWGVGDRGASCRVGRDVAEKGYGYFEDRRPAGNCDPYVVTEMLVQTCLNDE